MMGPTSYVLEEAVRRAIASQDALYLRPAHAMSPAEIKAVFSALPVAPLPPRPCGVTAFDDTVQLNDPKRDIAVRHFRPNDRVADAGSLKPVRSHVIYFHGGAFTLGGLDSHDAPCAALAAEAHVDVTAVNYRKLPEHPFPAAYHDAVGAVRALARKDRAVVVAGDSSGANLALAAAMALRADGPQIRALLLYYPIIGLTFETESYRRNAEAPALTAQRCRRIWSDYLSDDLTGVRACKDWRAAPLLADDFAGLPPVVTVTAEYDPLASDGEELVDRIQASGGNATLIVGAHLPHGFLKWRNISPNSAAAIAAATEALRKILAR